jgi:hypothetical protein
MPLLLLFLRFAFAVASTRSMHARSAASSPVKLNTPQSAPLGRVESARAVPDFSAQFVTRTLPMPRATGICAPATRAAAAAYHCCPAAAAAATAGAPRTAQRAGCGLRVLVLGPAGPSTYTAAWALVSAPQGRSAEQGLVSAPLRRARGGPTATQAPRDVMAKSPRR